MSKIFQDHPKFWHMCCGRTSSLESEPSVLWLIAPDRYKLLVFKAKCCFCHKQWRSHCPVHGSFFQPGLHSLWVNWCGFMWLMLLKQICDEFFIGLGGPRTSWTPWTSRATRTQRSPRRHWQRWSSWDAWLNGEFSAAALVCAFLSSICQCSVRDIFWGKIGK